MHATTRLARTRFVQHSVRLVFGVLSAAGIAAGPSYGAFGPKTLEVEVQHREDPLAIIRVTVAGKDILCGLQTTALERQPVVAFQAGDDWLRNTTIYLLNRTNKPIVFAQIVVDFPETDDGSAARPQWGSRITMGLLPAAVAYSGSTGKPLYQDPEQKPLLLGPGETRPVSLGGYIERIQGDVENCMPFDQVTRVLVRRSWVVFEDLMEWDGQYSAWEPANLGRWKKLAPGFFPGRPFWPPKPRQEQ